MNEDAAHAAQRAERRALRLSLGVSAAFAVVAVVWGLLAQSMVILLDAVYIPLSLLLTYGSLVVARVVARGPSRRFPFGRSALIPLFVIAQALVLFGLLGYASLEAVRVILAGGAPVSGTALVGYGVFSSIVSIAVWRALLRMARGQALVKAEAAGWLSSVVSSLAVAAGGIVVIAVQGTSWEWLAPYTDSVLVLVSGLLLLAVPLNLVRTSVRELQNPMPSPEITALVEELIEEVTRAESLPSPITRIGLMGRSLMVELAYVFDGAAADVHCEDRVRRAMLDGLASVPYEPWIVVEFSYNRELVE